LKGDVKSSFEASILTRRELETKVGFLVAIAVDYSFRIKLTINISSMTEHSFITDLPTIISSLLKLVVQTPLYYSFLDVQDTFPRPI
jgi:hypothetical protein